MPCRLAAAIDFGVAHRAARLDDRGDPGRGRLLDAVGEGEEPVRGEHAAGRVVALLPRLVDREEGAVHPAHLAGADADRRLVPREQDGVRLDRRHRGPGEAEVVPLALGRLRARWPPSSPGPTGSNWNWSCTRKPPRTRLKSSEPGAAAHRQLHHAQVLLARRRRASASSWNDGATTTSTKRSLIAWAVARSTTVLNATTEPNAETGSVARALAERLDRRCAPTAMPQGVVCLMIAQAGRVLQHATAHIAASMSSRLLNESSLPWRWVEVAHAARLLGHVERGALVRVLAVAQRLDALHRDAEPAGQALLVRREVAGDGGVVVGGVGEDLGRELAADRRRELVPSQQLEHAAGSRSDPRPAARTRGSWPPSGASRGRRCRCSRSRRRTTTPGVGDRRLEGIEVHRDQIDRHDAVLAASAARCSGRSRRASSAPWIAGCSVFTRPSSSSGKPVTCVDRRCTGDPGGAERGRGAAGGDDLPAELDQALGEGDDPALVADRDQRARHDDPVTTWTPRCREAAPGGPRRRRRAPPPEQPVLDLEHPRREPLGVSPGSTGTRAWARIAPRSYTSSTRWTVAPLSRAPLASTASCTRRPYMPVPPNAGSSAGCTLMMRPR